jgi:hypothetical protein
MSRFPKVLFDALRQMDAEANTSKSGKPVGLNWYGAYREPAKARPRTEVCWSERMGELLSERGFPTRVEVPYPLLPRCKCDNVVTLEDGTTLWLENKGAWRDYWSARGGMMIYRSYLLHPLVQNLDKTKTHTVPLDLKKLETLHPPHADRVGVLLVGFERDDDAMDKEIAELVTLGGLDRAPWTSAYDSWADCHRPGHNVRCWLWQRPTS